MISKIFAPAQDCTVEVCIPNRFSAYTNGDSISGYIEITPIKPIGVSSVDLVIGCESIGRVKVLTELGYRYLTYTGDRYKAVSKPIILDKGANNGIFKIEKKTIIDFSELLPDAPDLLSTYDSPDCKSRIEWFVEARIQSDRCSNSSISDRQAFIFTNSLPPTPITSLGNRKVEYITKKFNVGKWCWGYSGDFEASLVLPAKFRIRQGPSNIGAEIDFTYDLETMKISHIQVNLKSKETSTVVTPDGFFTGVKRDQTCLLNTSVSGATDAQTQVSNLKIRSPVHESFYSPQLRLEYKLEIIITVNGSKLRLSTPVEVPKPIDFVEGLPPYQENSPGSHP